MILLGVGDDDPVSFECDGKGVEVALKLGCGQPEDRKINRAVFFDKSVKDSKDFFDNGRICLVERIRGCVSWAFHQPGHVVFDTSEHITSCQFFFIKWIIAIRKTDVSTP